MNNETKHATVAYEESCWTNRLRVFAQRMTTCTEDAVRSGFITRLRNEQKARKRFLDRWDVRAAQCLRSANEVAPMLHDPEAIDAAVIELSVLAQHYTREEFPGLYRILDEIVGIADRTRSFRQQAYLAAYRAPANA